MSRFSGDPKIYITPNGATLRFEGGQPVMDQGLENSPIISLFTKPGWVGNAFIQNPDQQIGSDYEDSASGPITLTSLNNITDAAQKALSWMIDTGAASEIVVDVVNPSSNIILTTILIRPPGGNLTELLLTKNGTNWVAQANDPAHLK